jgi:hypothetical protein
MPILHNQQLVSYRVPPDRNSGGGNSDIPVDDPEQAEPLDFEALVSRVQQMQGSIQPLSESDESDSPREDQLSDLSVGRTLRVVSQDGNSATI